MDFFTPTSAIENRRFSLHMTQSLVFLNTPQLYFRPRTPNVHKVQCSHMHDDPSSGSDRCVEPDAYTPTTSRASLGQQWFAVFFHAVYFDDFFAHHSHSVWTMTKSILPVSIKQSLWTYILLEEKRGWQTSFELFLGIVIYGAKRKSENVKKENHFSQQEIGVSYQKQPTKNRMFT